MVFSLVRVTDDEIRQLLAEPERIYDFIEGTHNSLYLDKAWHGIHWLLTGSAYGGREPLCYLLEGGEPVGNDGFDYGPARALTSEQVASWNAALSGIPPEQLAHRFDPKAMLKADIYPQIWARSLKGEEDTLAYLLQAYERLRNFLAAAQEEHSGLLVYLS